MAQAKSNNYKRTRKRHHVKRKILILLVRVWILLILLSKWLVISEYFGTASYVDFRRYLVPLLNPRCFVNLSSYCCCFLLSLLFYLLLYFFIIIWNRQEGAFGPRVSLLCTYNWFSLAFNMNKYYVIKYLYMILFSFG